jgi:hypothetical protein
MAEPVTATLGHASVSTAPAVEMVKNWHCPSCHIEHRSVGPDTAMHHCKALNGLFIPLILDGVDATNRVLLREDYVKGDICSARDANNRVVMSVSQEHADGSNALTVFVPCATINLREES